MSLRAKLLRGILAVSDVEVISWPDGMDNLEQPWERLDPAVWARWELLADLLRLDELGQAQANGRPPQAPANGATVMRGSDGYPLELVCNRCGFRAGVGNTDCPQCRAPFEPTPKPSGKG